MNAKFCRGLRVPAVLCVGAVGFALFIPPNLDAAPPKKDEVRQGLEKVGNFFFKVARKLEQPGFGGDEDGRDMDVIYDGRRESTKRQAGSTVVTVESGNRGIYIERGGSFVPPNFQPHPQPRLHYGNGAAANGRTRLSIPVRPEGSTIPARPGSMEQPRAGSLEQSAGQAAAARTYAPREEVNSSKAVDPPEQGEPVFAERVPGHPGFVYPPGVEHDLKNMIDVRDFVAGQKVKDPRNGRVFLVPPK